LNPIACGYLNPLVIKELFLPDRSTFATDIAFSNRTSPSKQKGVQNHSAYRQMLFHSYPISEAASIFMKSSASGEAAEDRSKLPG
jgi:hypothetical protein